MLTLHSSVYVVNEVTPTVLPGIGEQVTHSLSTHVTALVLCNWLLNHLVLSCESEERVFRLVLACDSELTQGFFSSSPQSNGEVRKGRWVGAFKWIGALSCISKAQECFRRENSLQLVSCYPIPRRQTVLLLFGVLVGQTWIVSLYDKNGFKNTMLTQQLLCSLCKAEL